MNKISTLSKRRAVSPVIATVIIVAVTITVAVAVSYWMSGIASQYTAFEKVEIQTAICTWNETDPATGQWEIEVKLKNSGTATATLTNLFINEVEVNLYGVAVVGAENATTSMTQTETIESGAICTINVFIDGPGGSNGPGGTDQWQKVSSGTTINIKLHSAGGMDYIRLVRLT